MSLDFDTAKTRALRILDTTGHIAAVRLKSANKYIFRALLSLASANLFIRAGGMLNQVVVTYRFGQGAAMDSYFVASAIPILLAQLLATALESSVIPVYARVRTSRNKERASILFSTLLNILVIGLVVLTVGMLLLRNQVVFFSAIGLDPLRRTLAVGLTPYIFPVLLFMVINSFLECLLNSEGQFGWPAYAGLLVPLTTAGIVFVGGKSNGVVMLCIGTLLGEMVQMGVILYRARKAKLVYRPVIDWHNTELMTVLIVAWPALLSALISQASPLVDQIFASFLSTGSISTLNYSNKILSVFTGVIITSVGRAMLPYLSRQAGQKDMTAFKDTLRLYLWGIGIATIVLTAGMIVLAHPIVRILFQRGAFTDEDTTRTAITLTGFIIGLMPMALGFTVSKAFSALGKTRLLMYVTIFSVFSNALFDYILARFWQSFGIALATSFVYMCTLVILLITLRREIGTLNLLTPPREVLDFARRLGLEEYYMRLEETYNNGIPYRTRQLFKRGLISLVVFGIGITATFINALYTVKAAFGSLIVLALLRYRYALLLIWVLIDAFIGSTLPFFNGNNLLSGLTAPTLLLLFYLPLKQAFQRMPALGFFFVYLWWVFASIGFSPLDIGTFLTTWTTFMDFLGVAVLAIFVLTTRQRLLRVIDAILLSSLFIAVYGIYGYLIKQHGIPDASIPSLFRISSIFGNGPTTLSIFLSIVIPLAIYRATTLSGLWRVICAVGVLILVAALGLTFTRGAYISLPLSVVVMILFLPSRQMKVALLGTITALGGIAVVIAAVGNIPIFTRFLNQDIGTLNGRTYLWGAILDHFDPTKVLGNGLKASDALLTNLQIGNGIGVIGTAAHNIFLENLYDHGIIGVSLLALSFIAMVISLLRRMRKATPDHRLLLAACLATFINVFMQSLETNDIWNQGVGIYFWVIMALPFALCWTTPAPVTENEPETIEGETVEETLPAIQQEPLSIL
ncbi:MAG TPA: murein biosynthesis integral membrane protein MurJ [Ktedonobacteraceae bacterium]|nr:murein biosynthesis integral membrane protein MurJ [Ktedonobacteraceae bacterium]